MTLNKLGLAFGLAFLAPALALAAEPAPRGPALPAEVARVLRDQAKLTPVGDAVGDEFEGFGSAMAADGDTLVVGAPEHSLPWFRAGAAYVFVRTSGVWTLEAKLSPSSPGLDEGFGVAVAISGDTVVVGARSYSTEAYVFVRVSGTWVEEARIGGSDSEAFDGFGQAVSVDGDTLVVGAPGDTTGFGFNSGSAYVFVRTAGAWAQQQKLLPPDVAERDGFGRSVSVSGDTVVAGSPGDDTGAGIDAGSAYVFTRTGVVWTQEAKLLASAGAPDDQFGSTVSLDGDTVAVGLPQSSTLTLVGGAVQVFGRTGTSWSWEQTLTATVPYVFARFGTSIALEADALMVGAPGEPTTMFESASVYAFVRVAGTWTVAQSLHASFAEPWPAFGFSVALSGSAAFVGAPGRDDGSGSTYVFRLDGVWAEEARLDPPGTAKDDDFGYSLAMEGDLLVAGAPEDDLPQGRAAGAAYVFVRTGSTWSLQQKLVASDAAENARFGNTVALSGESLAVGTRETWETTGAVYMFGRVAGVWQQQQKLGPQAGTFDSSFGSALSLDADSLIVGAPTEDEPGTDESGAAYVFTRSGSLWSMAQRLVAPSDLELAGTAVAISGDTAIVGVPRGATGGRVLVYRRQTGTWSLVQQLTAADGAAGDWFGASVSLSGDTLLVGAPQRESSGYGAAYVFIRGGGPWSQQQKLVPEGPATQWWEFGTTVVVSGDAAVIAPSPVYSSDSSGPAVLLFERDGVTWTERQRISAFDGTPFTLFGKAIALAGSTAVVGAPGGTTTVGIESGAAYVLVPALTDLSVAVLASAGSVVQADTVTYAITVSNLGPDAAPEVDLVSTLDPGLIPESATSSQGSCDLAGPVATCDLGTIPAGAAADVSVVAVAAGVGLQANQVAILWAGADPVPGNNAASVSISVGAGGPADLSLTLTGFFATAAVDSPLNYRIDVANLGPATAAGVVVDDPTPPGLTPYHIGEACSTFPCLIPRLAAGETRQISAQFNVPAGYTGPDPVVNTATVTSATTDPDASNNASTVSTPFFVPAGNLGFHTLTPCRLFDTRDPGLGGPLPLEAGEVTNVYLWFGLCGVPPSAKTLALNVTVTEPSTTGNVRLYPTGLPVPQVSTVNYAAGQTRGGNGLVSLSDGAAFSIRVGQPSGTVHVIVDVFGYFE